jgi:hypothetical protein
MKSLGDELEIYGTFTLVIVDVPNVPGSHIAAPAIVTT